MLVSLSLLGGARGAARQFTRLARVQRLPARAATGGAGATAGAPAERRASVLAVIGAPLDASADPLAERPYERARKEWTYDLKTDDGIALDARDLRERRSDWLRDLLSIGNSRILDSLSERLVAVSVWNLLVTVLVEADRLSPLGFTLRLAERLSLPSWPLEAGSGLLAILLVFRTDQAYDRFWEARQRWADVQASTRSIALLSLAHYPPGRSRDLLLGHAATFPFALKQHMRGFRDLSRLEENWLPYAAPWLGEAEAKDELERWLMEDNVPTAVLEALSAEVGILLRPKLPRGFEVNAADSQGQRQGALWSQLQGHIEALAAATCACERLKLTPIPWACECRPPLWTAGSTPRAACRAALPSVRLLLLLPPLPPAAAHSRARAPLRSPNRLARAPLNPAAAPLRPPSPDARHTSRYCTLFLLALPFALDGEEGLPAWGRPLVALGFGYVLYGLEEIGHLIEEPFSVAYARGTARRMQQEAADSADGEGGGSGGGERGGTGRPQLVRACANALVGSAAALSALLRAVFGVAESADELSRRSAELEVLPLRKYCYIGAHELANLAAMRAGRELREAEARGGAARGAVSAVLRGADSAEPLDYPTGVFEEDARERGVGAPLTLADHPARYRQIASAAKQRLQLIGDRRL